jgi:hypothetical protein
MGFSPPRFRGMSESGSNGPSIIRRDRAGDPCSQVTRIDHCGRELFGAPREGFFIGPVCLALPSPCPLLGSPYGAHFCTCGASNWPLTVVYLIYQRVGFLVESRINYVHN